VHRELERVRQTFARHIAEMTPADLARPSNGTKWTNRQLLFHMLFGYIIIRRLIRMAKLFDYLPDWFTKAFAAPLNAGIRPFDWINYVGAVGGARIISPQRMQRWFDRLTLQIERDMDRQTSGHLARGMYYPVRWDPYFKPYMTLADIYHYPTQHFDHHDRQLSAPQ
jgi:DinB superfamily